MGTALQNRIEERSRQLELAEAALALGRRRHKLRRHGLAALGTPQMDCRALPWSLVGLAAGMRSCRTESERRAYRALLLHLEQWAESLLLARGEWPEHPFKVALLSLARQRPHWIRPLSEWRPPGRNPARQFSHLARFLLARYQVPAFLESAFFERDPGETESWLRHVGQGASLRTAPGMTAPLTKRMAHHALQAPDVCTPVQAVRWGQVLALGGDPQLAFAVNKSTLGDALVSEPQEAWRLAIIHWLVNHQPLEPERVKNLVDFAIRSKRRERQFSLQGRTPQSIERLIEEARMRAQARARERTREDSEEQTRYQYRQFAPSGLAAGIWEFGNGARRQIWMLDEIRCNRDLIQEGRHMRHCVATYEDYIVAGTSSIWTLRVEREGSVKRAVTIEVAPKTGQVIECRGKCNRSPNAEERRILDRWARENHLELAIDWQR